MNAKLSPEKRAEHIRSLRQEIEPGATVYVIVKSSTNSSYVVSLYALHDGRASWLTGQARELLGFPAVGNGMRVRRPGYGIAQYLSEVLGLFLYDDARAIKYELLD